MPQTIHTNGLSATALAEEPTPVHTPMVSVIVTTYNRPEHLARCLPTILANDYPNFELIVVDHSEADDSQNVIAGLGNDTRIKNVRFYGSGRTSSLNVGLAHAHGEVIALTDDDCTVPPTWLRRAVEVLTQEQEAGVVYGALAATPHDPTRTYIPKFAPPRYRRFRGRLARNYYGGKGANMVVRRAVYERVGGCDPVTGGGAQLPGADDTDIAYRAVTAGFAVVEDPENVVVHWGARDYDSGAGVEYISFEYRAMGGCYTRLALRGDVVATYLVLQELAVLAGRVVANSLRRRRPLGVRHLISFLQGVAAVLKYGRKGGPEKIALAPEYQTARA